jgi:hypothetical protein
MVPVKLPISGEIQLTIFPSIAQLVIVAVEKQGEPVIVIMPEKVFSD